ncbi:TRAP transporter small permease [Boseongicola aestuarii]|uniref:TRAP transporter small permease protein n=1 Tax=Boseongicola aestuarii TaxID=1470561 RepID=A0A238J3Z7_9RHOB|nr:TRAP transporter small permease subunit [Boseongicola aestuarii]SMX25469.1 Tripartite ATP-independent periplasmic transporters, DctQ component [Boseongicola aestuarii]
MSTLLKWFTRGAEFIAAMALAAIFVTFLLQILFRYVPFLEPIGWSVVVISLLWVFVIFFGSSFIVREIDHVTFDIVYLSVPQPVRKVLALITAVLMVVAMLYSLPAVWETVFANRLMELKKIQTIRVPITGDKIAIKWLFAPFVMLMIVVTLRYIWRIYTVLRFGPPDTEIGALLSGEEDKMEPRE